MSLYWTENDILLPYLSLVHSFACIQNKLIRMVQREVRYLVFIAVNHAEVKGFMLSPLNYLLLKLSLLNGSFTNNDSPRLQFMIRRSLNQERKYANNLLN